jgi:hypothetical protein
MTIFNLVSAIGFLFAFAVKESPQNSYDTLSLLYFTAMAWTLLNPRETPDIASGTLRA